MGFGKITSFESLSTAPENGTPPVKKIEALADSEKRLKEELIKKQKRLEGEALNGKENGKGGKLDIAG
jgi:hypothetical protein